MPNESGSDTTKNSSKNNSDDENPPDPEVTIQNDDSLSETFLDEVEDIATIKFRTQEGEIFTKAFKRSSTIGHIKTELSTLFSIPTTQISIENDGKPLSDDDILAALGVAAMGILAVSYTHLTLPTIYSV